MQRLRNNPQLDMLAPDADALDAAKNLERLDHDLASFVARHLSLRYTVVEIEYALAALASARLPDIRAHAARLTASHLPSVWARDIICGLMTDPDDVVCLEAMRVAGDAGIEEAAHYLLKIIGPPSTALTRSVSPVGRGAAVARSALLSILGVMDLADADHIASRERLLATGAPMQPFQTEQPNGFDSKLFERWLLENAMPDDMSMALVPGGTYTIGLNATDVPDRMFAWERATPARRLWFPPFLIDKTPVTVHEYDIWCASEESRNHDYCHPMEPSGKDHARNTILDPRVGADHPVTGVDWFDAVSYARCHGKELPTEFQWEVAARGPSSSIWPWGNSWDPSRAWWFRQVFGPLSDEPCLQEWRSRLASALGRTNPPRTTASVFREGSLPNPFGLYDLSGNCWEWTRSELSTSGPYSPTIQKFQPANPASVVLKGGAWTSLPGQLFPAFRGQDAPFCRHDEIGFRCVIQVPYALMRQELSPDIRRFGRQHY